jgi:hypothetical protein
MRPINKLTTKQISKIPGHIKKWIDIGLCTLPANRDLAEKAINKIYKVAGLKKPNKIVWCGSPLSQGVCRFIVRNIQIDSIRTSIGDSVMDSVWDSIWASVMDSVSASIGASVMDSVMDSVWDSIWASVMDSVWDSIWASVRDSVWASIGASIGASVMDSVRDSVRASVRDSVWASVRASIGASIGDSVWDSYYGGHEAGWLSFYDFFRTEVGLKKETDKLQGLLELAQHAGWFLPHENICWVSERHCSLKRDEQGRLHSLNSPAIEYPDGWKIYAVHGVRVPESIIISPETITIKDIEDQDNVEVKRVMIDQYGPDKYLVDSGAQLIHKDAYGELYKKGVKGDEPIVMVKVINSTPESDGTSNNYYLRVPPDTKTARAAVAWTFGLQASKYKPKVQT